MKKKIFSAMTAFVVAGLLSGAYGQSAGGGIPVKTFKTKTGKTFSVQESHPQGQSLSDISVTLSGVPKADLKFKDAEPVNKVLMGDLDGNGFDELYITTVSAGSGSYGNILGIASNKDKSLLQILVPPVEENDMKPGGNFEGYEGHDTFAIEGNTLIRSFPVKGHKSATRKVSYLLKAGEAGFVLFVKSSSVK
ncbi:MAG: hypothetical protein ACOYNC_03825 [Bacteroidales bacterium]